jgi:protein TonB
LEKGKRVRLTIGFCFLVLLLGACAPWTEPPPVPTPVAAGQKDAQQEYLWQVMRRLAQFPYMPKATATVRETGTVLLRLTVSRDGRLLDVALERSSGVPSLDAGVMESARRASPYPPLPAEIQGDRHAFLLPVSFRYNALR